MGEAALPFAEPDVTFLLLSITVEEPILKAILSS
jgi:hypothetical protein